MDKILSITSVDKLPLRRIVDTQLNDKKTISYGIMAYAADTQKWLLVQRRHSSALLTILNGMYRDSSLCELLTNATTDEVRLLKEAKDNKFAEARKIIDDIDVEYLDKRFSSAHFIKTIKNVKPAKNNDWGWPKGKAEYPESELQTAEREFAEETKLTLDNALICPKPITSSFRICNKVIETKCWLLIYKKEPLLTDAFGDEIEVNDRKWFTEKQVRTLLTSDKLKLLDEADKVIKYWLD